MITPKFHIWIKRAGVRAIKTIAQTMIATIGTSVALSDVDWKLILSASALAGILSLLTSVAGLPEVEADEEARKLAESKALNGQNE